jgi:hypothetical protein
MTVEFPVGDGAIVDAVCGLGDSAPAELDPLDPRTQAVASSRIKVGAVRPVTRRIPGLSCRGRLHRPIPVEQGVLAGSVTPAAHRPRIGHAATERRVRTHRLAELALGFVTRGTG